MGKQSAIQVNRQFYHCDIGYPSLAHSPTLPPDGNKNKTSFESIKYHPHPRKYYALYHPKSTYRRRALDKLLLSMVILWSGRVAEKRDQ